MRRAQRQAHLLAWLIVAPVLALVVLIVLLAGPLEAGPPPGAASADASSGNVDASESPVAPPREREEPSP